jgi:hypothetical protein
MRNATTNRKSAHKNKNKNQTNNNLTDLKPQAWLRILLLPAGALSEPKLREPVDHNKSIHPKCWQVDGGCTLIGASFFF